eukprot:SAG31_NODE_970_length_10676_cov_12.566985_4_plen_247_part_00
MGTAVRRTVRTVIPAAGGSWASEPPARGARGAGASISGLSYRRRVPCARACLAMCHRTCGVETVQEAADLHPRPAGWAAALQARRAFATTPQVGRIQGRRAIGVCSNTHGVDSSRRHSRLCSSSSSSKDHCRLGTGLRSGHPSSRRRRRRRRSSSSSSNGQDPCRPGAHLPVGTGPHSGHRSHSWLPVAPATIAATTAASLDTFRGIVRGRSLLNWMAKQREKTLVGPRWGCTEIGRERAGLTLGA